MKLTYDQQICPFPISLSVGTLVKPQLRDIFDTEKGMSLERFSLYETALKLTPELYFTKLGMDDEKRFWESLSPEERDKTDMFDVVSAHEQLWRLYEEVFNFFFKETAAFRGDCFVMFTRLPDNKHDISPENDIRGVISKHTFLQTLNIIQQICCIDDKEDEVPEESEFKNKLAKKLYEKIRKAEKKKQTKLANSRDYTLPNLISAVSNRHPTVSPITVWNLTIFQLHDSFNRLKLNQVLALNSAMVSAWGDEKKTFDADLWYKNEYDKS